MFSLCDQCYLGNQCQVRQVIVPSQHFIRIPEERLVYQNHLIKTGLSWRSMVDYHINMLCVYPGLFTDRYGVLTRPPSTLPLLEPGADFWFREQMRTGPWDISDVPRIRSEAIGKWIVIGTVVNISRGEHPPCFTRRTPPNSHKT